MSAHIRVIHPKNYPETIFGNLKVNDCFLAGGHPYSKVGDAVARRVDHPDIITSWGPYALVTPITITLTYEYLVCR